MTILMSESLLGAAGEAGLTPATQGMLSGRPGVAGVVARRAMPPEETRPVSTNSPVHKVVSASEDVHAMVVRPAPMAVRVTARLRPGWVSGRGPGTAAGPAAWAAGSRPAP